MNNFENAENITKKNTERFESELRRIVNDKLNEWSNSKSMLEKIEFTIPRSKVNKYIEMHIIEKIKSELFEKGYCTDVSEGWHGAEGYYKVIMFNEKNKLFLENKKLEEDIYRLKSDADVTLYGIRIKDEEIGKLTMENKILKEKLWELEKEIKKRKFFIFKKRLQNKL